MRLRIHPIYRVLGWHGQAAGLARGHLGLQGVNSNTTAKVHGDNGSVAIKNAQISDGFKPLEAHVYVV